MGFFSKKKQSGGESTSLAPEENSIPKVCRYTDVNKSPEQNQSWDKSIALFNEKKYLDSFLEFFMYLNDKQVNNVFFQRNEDEVVFEIHQGSKIIRGNGNNSSITAETSLATVEKLSVAVMRILMNRNYVLKYSRFALKNNEICLKFDSHSIDASPNKLYASLRELSLEADKQDDLLVAEFSSSLVSVNTDHVIDLHENIKETRYKYLRLWIDKTISRIGELDEDKLSGAISYLLLSLTFKIDTLIQPQGKLAYDLEKMQTLYFAQDNKTLIEKCREMKEELTRIRNIPREELMKSLYDVKLTFGIVPASTHEQVYKFMLDEFSKTKWYADNKYPDIVLAIYEYIVGYCFFNFGMYEATYQLFTMFYNITEPDFFAEMGYPEILYHPADNKFNSDLIKNRINAIVTMNKSRFPLLNFVFDYINYNSLNEFIHSFLNEITYLNFGKQ